MPKRLGKFELPSKLTKIEEGSTPTYAKFIAEPFEAGYGHIPCKPNTMRLARAIALPFSAMLLCWI